MRCDHERRDPAQQIHPELDHIHPHDRAQPADPRIDHGHDPDCEDANGEAGGSGDFIENDGERNRGREDAHAVGEGAGEEEQPGGRAPRLRAEAALEPLVGSVLGAFEIARQQVRGDPDPPDQIAKRDL